MTTIDYKHPVDLKNMVITSEYQKPTCKRYQCPYLPKGQHCPHELRVFRWHKKKAD